MPTIMKTISVNATGGAFVQLDSLQGRATIILYTGNASGLVTNAVDATAAATENTAGRYFLTLAGTNPTFEADPCKTWIRSGGSAYTAYAIISW